MLLIEDDEGDALLVSEELSDVPGRFSVQWVRTIAEADGPLAAGVDCVLLDLDLPDATGLEGIHAVRSRAPDAAVVVLTGRDDESVGIDALGAGAQDYLVKGRVDGQLLARAIRYAVERRRAEREALELQEARLLARENARLQRGLLPTPLISDPAFQIGTGYIAGRGRGAVLSGDFYDAVELPDGSIHVVIGDVSGHSADEAALAACLRIAWRTLAITSSDEAPPPLRALEQVLALERQDEDTFATLCAVTVSPDRGHLEMRLAGHPLPILVDDAGVRLVPGATRTPVGLAEGAVWPSTGIEPQGPWSLFLYTDGLLEAHVGEGPERLGAERLVDIVREILDNAGGNGAQAFVDDVIERVSSLGSGGLTDDAAALWLTARR